jgi:hypothetical protein
MHRRPQGDIALAEERQVDDREVGLTLEHDASEIAQSGLPSV